MCIPICIKNNGWISKNVKCTEDYVKDVPYQQHYFLFVMEILNDKINSSNSIRRFRLENMEKK